MKQLPFLLSFGALILIGGCDTEGPLVTSGSRAELLVQGEAVEHNGFVGIWTSPPGQTVNDWLVAFTPSGLVAVDGPGLKADGTYRAEGHLAKSAYTMRNGEPPRDSKTKETVFQLSADGTTLVFSTGEPMDPRVKLVRSAEDQTTLPLPSIRQTAEPTMNRNPFTLACLGLAG
jgi:hypothetical protein